MTVELKEVARPMTTLTHNNLFLAYERQPEYFEDTLSRAAVLVMRLVPLA